MEEAERERKVKQAAESAVEKYHVYDDDYDVEDVEGAARHDSETESRHP